MPFCSRHPINRAPAAFPELVAAALTDDSGEHSRQSRLTHDTRIGLFLIGELVAALRANDSDLFKRWLYGGIEDLGEPAVTELLMDWFDPFLTVEEQDRLLVWHLGVSL